MRYVIRVQTLEGRFCGYVPKKRIRSNPTEYKPAFCQTLNDPEIKVYDDRKKAMHALLFFHKRKFVIGQFRGYLEEIKEPKKRVELVVLEQKTIEHRFSVPQEVDHDILDMLSDILGGNSFFQPEGLLSHIQFLLPEAKMVKTGTWLASEYTVPGNEILEEKEGSCDEL